MTNRRAKGSGNLLRLVARGGAIIFWGSVFGKGLRFILHLVLARILGAALYGIYCLSYSFIDISAYIGLLGDGRGVIKLGAIALANKDTAKLKEIILNFLGLVFSISTFIAVMLFIFSNYISISFFKDMHFGKIIRIFSYGFPFYIIALATVPIGIIFQKIIQKMIIQEICHPLFNLSLIIIFFILGYGLTGAAAAFAISSFLCSILGIYLIIKIFPELISKARVKINAGGIFFPSLPLGTTFFLYFLIFKLDRIFIGYFLSAADVGIYSAATNVAMNILIFVTIFENSFSPILAQLCHNKETIKLKRIYGLVAFWGLWLTFLPSIILIIFNSEILSLFGSNFKAGSPVLIITVSALLFEAVFGQARQLFQMSSRQNIELINSLLLVILNVTLNIIFIPRLGILGAAFAIFLSLFLISLLRYAEVKKIFGFDFFNSRYIKLLIFIFLMLFLSISRIEHLNFIPKIIYTFIIIISFFYFSYLLRTRQDLLMLEALKITPFRKDKKHA